MSDGTGYLFGGFFAGMWLFYKGFSSLQRQRIIENTPTSKVRSIAMGMVEVYGKAVAIKPVQAPFSGKRCICSYYTVEKRVSSGKRERWVMVKKGVVGPRFYVQDETGKVLVDATDAEFNIPSDFRVETGSFNETMTAFLAENKIQYKGWLGNKHLRLIEYNIEQGNSVYIMGTASKNPEVSNAVENAQGVMICSAAGAPFFICDRPEKEILASLHRWSIGGIWGGAALMVLFFFLILARFGWL